MHRNVQKAVLIIIVFFSLGCKQNPQANPESTISKDVLVHSSDTAAYFFIEENVRDFGTINKNEKESVKVSFEFTNTGQNPLVFIKATPSCGCMEAEIPTQPIGKGEKGKIDVLVDVRKEEGGFNKNVIIKSNAENDVILLRIKGTVK